MNILICCLLPPACKVVWTIEAAFFRFLKRDWLRPPRLLTTYISCAEYCCLPRLRPLQRGHPPAGIRPQRHLAGRVEKGGGIYPNRDGSALRDVGECAFCGWRRFRGSFC